MNKISDREIREKLQSENNYKEIVIFGVIKGSFVHFLYLDGAEYRISLDIFNQKQKDPQITIVKGGRFFMVGSFNMSPHYSRKIGEKISEPLVNE